MRKPRRMQSRVFFVDDFPFILNPSVSSQETQEYSPTKAASKSFVKKKGNLGNFIEYEKEAKFLGK